MKLGYLLVGAVLSAAGRPDEAAADFAAGRWEALHARFSAQMKAAATVDKLQGLAVFGKCEAPAEPPVEGKAPAGFATHTYKIVCAQKTVGLRLTTDSAGLIQGIFFVEPPAPAAGLAVVTGEYRLPAELTMPAGAGPFPAVVLVHGSGPHDMDETIGPNKPFLEIARGLAAHGIATLRYTKRTKQYAGSLPSFPTLAEETVDDALSAVKLLRGRPGIDARKIFVIGHSLGAYAAPRMGQADPEIAGLVLLAGYTRPLGELIEEQVLYMGGTAEQAAEMKRRFPESYLKDASADPVPVAAGLQMRMLILQGERDYQVTMKDFRGWEKLRGPRVTLKSYPALNHLFQPGEGKSTGAEYEKAVPFSAGVIDDIAAWIKK